VESVELFFALNRVYGTRYAETRPVSQMESVRFTTLAAHAPDANAFGIIETQGKRYEI